ncbi:serine/threonine protein phosphatase [Streptomyces hygroscopicus]|uniref:serine/threonine-protein kinase n=1 Tax=Streptomyces hygroscopicus TaxID=1912 RepID=UPI00223F604C|nr:serine/threonine-protein kinase [Streptomyces hygroscopicus]MCW7943984.1 serine/threonine protein phosphatase [Streptomyces hygroscopicus]
MPSGSPQSGVGRVIAGRYLLLNRLGAGAMGHVWLAHDQRLACEVALKEIVFRDPAEATEERAARVARARAEARHAAGLRGHPHVVTVHDVLEHEGLPWIVMEYVAGALDLRDRVHGHGPLAPAEAARIGLAVLDALTAGHERGVMHRDVKPANILLAPDRTGTPHARVLLTDYGISVQPDAGETRYTKTSALIGTSGYLAPERATGGPPTAAADLFSLGCTLYFAVEGCGPFERDTPLAEITAVVLEEPRPAARAGALAPLLAAMLVKDPALRITAADTAAALAAVVAPQPHPRTRVDLGSQPPWELSDTRTETSPRRPVGGFGAAPGYGGPGTAPPAGSEPGVRVRPVPPVTPSASYGEHLLSGPDAGGSGHPFGRGERHPRRSHLLRALTACALGLLLALCGVWYAMTNRTAGSTAKPYGDAVALARPLKEGDCVVADWPGGPFQGGAPRLTVDPSCADRTPDGQVMAVVASASADEARTRGPAECEQRTQGIRANLADVRSYAVVPSPAGFETADRRTACLVLGAHGPVYGPLGDHRAPGMTFVDTANMQKRDCLDAPSLRVARLVSCRGTHDQQVLGFTRLGPDTTLTRAKDLSDAACARDVPPKDYGYDPARYEAASWTGKGAWTSGTHLVVCTVRKQNGGTMGKDEP